MPSQGLRYSVTYIHQKRHLQPKLQTPKKHQWPAFRRETQPILQPFCFWIWWHSSFSDLWSQQAGLVQINKCNNWHPPTHDHQSKKTNIDDSISSSCYSVTQTRWARDQASNLTRCGVIWLSAAPTLSCRSSISRPTSAATIAAEWVSPLLMRLLACRLLSFEHPDVSSPTFVKFHPNRLRSLPMRIIATSSTLSHS